MKLQILVVDDDPLVNDFLVESITRTGHSVKSVLSAREALGIMGNTAFDVMISDIKMKGMDGIELLEIVRSQNPDLLAIMITAYGTVENAVTAMKLGAYDYILKPISPDAVEMMIHRIEEVVSLRSENKRLKTDLIHRFQNIVGKTQRMKEIFELVESTADARSTVLITGPSGPGKELVARAFHHASIRRERPFIKLNCAALPENLVESELFGYEKGAFTGAVRQHKGRFELADGGTLLLDEISEIPMGLQAKLLRVLQEKEFERIGSGDTIKVDVRIIATSNQDLKRAIKESRFREDLYYRLNVIPVELPPLKDRLEDIPLLTNHFIQKYNRENNKDIRGIEDNVMKLFMNYHWPGNIRELENYIERAVVTAPTSTLARQDFPAELVLGKLSGESINTGSEMTLAEGEKLLILKTLERFGGNKTKAAEALDITPRTIRNKLVDYGIAGQDQDD